jgi:hypothetical protein
VTILPNIVATCAGPLIEDVCSKAFSLVIMLQLCNGKWGHAGWVKNPYSFNSIIFIGYISQFLVSVNMNVIYTLLLLKTLAARISLLVLIFKCAMENVALCVIRIYTDVGCYAFFRKVADSIFNILPVFVGLLEIQMYVNRTYLPQSSLRIYDVSPPWFVE